jgi:hypothetical protein
MTTCDLVDIINIKKKHVAAPNFRFFYPDTGSIKFLRNIGTLLPDYIASHPRERILFTAVST